VELDLHQSDVTQGLPPRLARFVRVGAWGFAAVLALACYLVPQDAPLVWYPLNSPGDDLYYLEISCASSKAGEVQIRYDVADMGHRPGDTIRIPVSKSAVAFTYTYPLPDAAIVEMRVAFPADRGEVAIRNMRVINRRGEEIRRFTRDMFRAQNQISAITATADGWTLQSAPGSVDPFARIELFSPIHSPGANRRNLERCFLSTGYLAVMLAVMLVTLFCTLSPLAGRSGLLRHAAPLTAVALVLAVIGNRGLIANSIRFAHFRAPPIPPGLHLEFDLTSGDSGEARLHLETADGLPSKPDLVEPFEMTSGLQVVRFPLSVASYRIVRFSPAHPRQQIAISGIRLVDNGQRTVAALPLQSLTGPGQGMNASSTDVLTIDSASSGGSPALEMNSTGLAMLNRALQKPASTDR